MIMNTLVMIFIIILIYVLIYYIFNYDWTVYCYFKKECI